MIQRGIRLITTVTVLVLLIPGIAGALEMEGKIQYLTNKFKTFLLVETNTGKTEIFKFGKKTGSLQPNDLVRVSYSKGKNGQGFVKATSVKKLYAAGGVSPKQFKKLQASGAVILDVRTNRDLKKGKIANAIHIPLNKLESKLGTLSKSKPIVVYCNTGPIAAIGYHLLKNNGFPKANYLAAKVKFKKGKLSIY